MTVVRHPRLMQLSSPLDFPMSDTSLSVIFPFLDCSDSFAVSAAVGDFPNWHLIVRRLYDPNLALLPPLSLLPYIRLFSFVRGHLFELWYSVYAGAPALPRKCSFDIRWSVALFSFSP